MTSASILGAVGAADADDIEAAKLAAAKGSAAATRTFASSLVKAHQTSLQKNTELSKRLRLKRLLPADSASVRLHKAEMDLLNLSTGAAFDSAFVKAVIASHEVLIKKINTELLPVAQSASVKAFLRQELPVLGVHLTRARELLAKM